MKRLLFFPGHRMIAYEWEANRFLRAESFEPDETGRAEFRAWLAEAPRSPVQLLIDVIEEEFHVDQVPHVIGRDRGELLKRTAQKHFRSTEFRYITAQGRLRTGRRDDRVLIAGLTNPDLLRPWLTVIDEVEVPLRGIHSLPLIGETLLPLLGLARTPRVMLVSQEVPSTLRQSYYEQGRLRFSRLAPGRYADAAGYAAFVDRELDQTLRFLEAQRFRRHDQPVRVLVIAADDSYHALRDHLSSSDSVTCELMTLDRAAERVGLRGQRPGPWADALFAQALLRLRRPPNHYGLPRLRRHFFVRRARIALAAAAVMLLVAAAGLAGAQILRVQGQVQATEAAQARAAQFDRRYDARLRQLAAFDYRAVDVKNAVDLLDVARPVTDLGPLPVMQRLGAALGEHEYILLRRMDWVVSSSDEVATGSGGSGAFGAVAPVLAGGPPETIHHHVLVAADVVGFAGDYRTAVERFEAFVARLREESFDRVEIAQAPFDLEPDTGVSGDSGLGARDQEQRAGFALRLRLGEVIDDAR